ncbi:hypothetical protein EJ03DRAFT_334522 [Teratosphaeria nubilosa]|uniref:PH domain-containing protein n=1 Tax=Teratosphaeria nubilosa TaxID=161662 RepID=A0A6G1LIH6_9PEZI|nr:hypothetical protein EJ03DRAFT_334522 [Teratosphaeria nubilosa]
MSLFNLFSKPKHEKAHGYAEQGLDLSSGEILNARSEHLTVPLPTRGDALDEDARPPTAISGRTIGQKPPKRRSSKPDDKPRPWTPPPLFQAYPQASKHGVMEVSTVAETVAAKAKGRKAAGLRTLDHEHLSRDAVAYSNNLESKSSTRAPVKDSSRPTSSLVEVTNKIVVLITSGYLLQYADTGPSDRLPERTLQLSKDSAAFACDLISGKHYVLQVSHAVNSEGMSITNGSNIFSRLSNRSTVSKKMTATLLLVTKDAREMNSWMVAIREEIEILGGRKSRPDTAVEAMLAGTADGFSELKKSPSLSHRYNVSRATGATIPSRQDIESMPAPPSSKQEDLRFDKSETNTIDGIEQEMEQLVDERPGSAPQKQQRDSDARSVRSSTALSADSGQLCSPQSSSRISYSTFATTAATSRTSSPSESQLADSEKWSSDSSRDSDQSRSLYVPRSSLNVGDWKRKSVMPSGMKKQQPLRISDKNAHTRPRSQNNVRHDRMPTATLSTPPRKLVMAASEPDFRAVLENRTRHDSRLEDVVERPQSTIAELPSLADWNAIMPNKRHSLKNSASAQTQTYRVNVRPPASNSVATMAPAIAMVNGSQSHPQHFSIPLKIKPTSPAGWPSCQPEAKADHLDADADTTCRTLITSPEAHRPNRERNPSGRLSLFPSQVHPVLAPDGPLPALPLSKRSSPERTPHQTRANARALRRPASLQVMSDQAPFLHSSQGCTTSGTSQVSHARKIPTRSLKTSRSSHAISTPSSVAVSRPQASPTDPFMQFSARPLHSHTSPVREDEAGDQAMPLLPRRSDSPELVRPGSRQANGRLGTKASLPELDLGMPLVGLGPPAPPPSAPLPRPPTAERSASPAPPKARTGEPHRLSITVPT